MLKRSIPLKLDYITEGVGRLRRSIAQRGLAKTLGNLTSRWRSDRIRAGEGGASSLGSHDFDLEFGVDTSGMISGQKLATGHAHDLYNTAYYAIAPSLFRALLRRWEATPRPYPTERYTFIDLGAGKGRAVMLASELPFQSSIGVELNPGLAKVAMGNLEKWQSTGRCASPAEIRCQDATEFQFPANPCVVYLFNPFSGAVLKRLLERIQTNFLDRPGQLDLLYVNPEFEFLIYQNRGFARLWEQQMKMSREDAVYDGAMLGASNSGEYSTTGNEPCTAWRWKGHR
jgi:hypothetical protein